MGVSKLLIHYCDIINCFNIINIRFRIHNNINPASSLPIKSDYSFFREGVRPEWEDVHNKTGGKWAFQNKGRGGNALDEMWLTTVGLIIFNAMRKRFFVIFLF